MPLTSIIMESGDERNTWMGDYFALIGDGVLHSDNGDTRCNDLTREAQRWVNDALPVPGNCSRQGIEEVATRRRN